MLAPRHNNKILVAIILYEYMTCVIIQSTITFYNLKLFKIPQSSRSSVQSRSGQSSPTTQQTPALANNSIQLHCIALKQSWNPTPHPHDPPPPSAQVHTQSPPP